MAAGPSVQTLTIARDGFPVHEEMGWGSTPSAFASGPTRFSGNFVAPVVSLV